MAEVSFHHDALEELEAATCWYIRKSQIASEQFVFEVERVISVISRMPQFYPHCFQGFRQAVLNQFPFSIVYMIQSDETIFILAVAHHKRKPGYWRKRLGS